ncbi:cyclophilin-like fold protein [Enterococcus sp. HY326]|uniref:cyclophilin-like fold protein n=1 Tax=Enterococcus sp. HY326 TaxID=2971265 RepID=UPI0022403697|nr:cyclophilin-like fold protein [Enterococcus sp. HY326]
MKKFLFAAVLVILAIGLIFIVQSTSSNNSAISSADFSSVSNSATSLTESSIESSSSGDVTEETLLPETSSSLVNSQEVEEMKIVLTVAGESQTATLNNSAAARDFYALLPLDLTMEDYAQSEKIADLPQTLDTSDSPAGTAAEVGDLTMFEPWGNLAIFYRSIGYSNGLILLGSLDGEIDFLTNQTGDFILSIRQA